MRLEDITILSSISPVQLKTNPTPLTYEFIASFITNQELHHYIEQIRAIYNPNNNADIKSFIGKNLFDNSEVAEVLNNTLLIFPEHLLSTYGIHKDFIINIALLMYFNAVIDIEDFQVFKNYDIELVATKKEITNKLWDLPYEACAIIIPYSSSARKLKKYIDNHTAEINNLMDKTLFKNTFLNKINENTEIATEIIILHDQDRKTFDDISKILTDKYPDNASLFEETYINKLYHRHKEFRKLTKVQDSK